MHEDLGRTWGGAHRCSDLSRCQSRAVAQQEGGALPIGQTSQASLDQVDFGQIRVLDGGVRADVGGLRPAPAHVVEEGRPRDGEQP